MWAIKGNPIPPPHQVKQKIIRSYQKKFLLKTLVETGTFYGDMISAMRKYFDVIYSIELSPYFYELAIRRFKNKKEIKIYNGDSSVFIGIICDELKEPALFWLDGHYSGGETAKGITETPVIYELEVISHFKFVKNSVILIDDARCFNGSNDYPYLVDLIETIKKYFPKHKIKVDSDIIQIYPL